MNITSFTVLADTPKELKALNDIAYNLWFSWNPEARQLFYKLDPSMWESTGKNPVRMLCMVPQERLEKMAHDRQFLAELEVVSERFQDYLEERTWYDRQYGQARKGTIAYFSCEFGMHESLPVYSGGLGVLAGDHVKSASDLGLPLVGIGLLYRQGYFRQYLNAEGMQQERYPENDWYSMPVHLEKDEEGEPLLLSMEMGADTVYFQIWRVDVGRCCLYLLDTNLEHNAPQHRAITTRLYDPDRDIRLRQELLLGIGGVRALHALGLDPQVFHVNEGHSAFLLLERVRQLMAEYKLSFEEARTVVWSTTVFTTHTPVPAGNERFNRDLLRRYLEPLAKKLGRSWEQFLAIGLENPGNGWEEYCLTILALRFAAFCNGVARLHGHVSRQMWQGIYPAIPEQEVPIGHVTNGVHSGTWLSSQMRNVFLRYMGSSVLTAQADATMWNSVDTIPDAELWATHEANRARLVDFVRSTVRMQNERRGSNIGDDKRTDDIFDPKALTIGFARRFATYKRGYLLFKDPDRLARLLLDRDHPVQVVLAGKAHPADQGGKDIIRAIYSYSRRPELRKRVVVLEDYDFNIARTMLQGVDVWLNNPRRPLEASGTSGMKAAMNGALNVSILDGWWDEAYTPDVGWAIGNGETYQDHEWQDNVEADLLLGVLEKQVVPLFYEREASGLPREWVRRMKQSMRILGGQFNSHRMITEYCQKYYHRCLELNQLLRDGDFAEARAMAAWLAKLNHEWRKIEIVRVESPVRDFLYKGSEIEVKAWVKLNDVAADNVIVEVYHGPLDNQKNIETPHRARMAKVEKEGDQTVFRATFPCARGGHYGYGVRVLPGRPNLAVEFLPGLMKWF